MTSLRKKMIGRSAMLLGIFSLMSSVGGDPLPASVSPRSTTGAFASVQGISVPSAVHNLQFMAPGILNEMMVKEGDHLQKGQLVASEKTELEQLQLKTMMIDANSTTQIEAAKVESEAKKSKRDRLQRVFNLGTGAVTPDELQEAVLDYDVSVLKIKLSDEEHQQKQADAAKQAAKIELMKLYSPVEGIVQKINCRPGGAVDPNIKDGVMTVVVNSPVWIEIHLTSKEAARLKQDQAVEVAYANEPGVPLSGKVIYKDPIVDAASDTQTVRLELPNTENRPSGLLLNIRLPDAEK